MGMGDEIINRLFIGDGTIVGVGAVVVKSLPERCMVSVKPIKFHEENR